MLTFLLVFFSLVAGVYFLNNNDSGFGWLLIALSFGNMVEMVIEKLFL